MVGPWLPPADLTASGRPAFLPGEIERFLVPSVDLNPETPALPPLRSGVLSLTTHRLIWIDDRSASAFYLPLAAVVHIFPPKTRVFHSPRVRIQVSVSADGRVGERGERSEVVVVVFRGRNDPDVFHHGLVEVWGSRSWERGVEEVGVNGGEGTGGGWSGEGTSSRPWAAPVVGVSGILRKEQEIWESTDKSLQDAFQDLNALMSKAKEMVMLAEKMRQKLLSGSTSQANAGNDEEMGSKQEMQDWLLSVGIASPVTKESAGALYHQQLSRQVGPEAQKKFEQTIFFSHSHLADFVKPQLERAGGMMALIDIYCHFNRARGTALISPEDLLQACALWEKIDVPVMLRKFDSGVMVIQNKAHSDEEVFARIRSLVMKPDALQKGISPSDAAITLGVAPALAKEHLLAAENKGLLCRDISPEGFRFYANLFKDVNPGDMYRVNDHSLLHVWVSATAVTG